MPLKKIALATLIAAVFILYFDGNGSQYFSIHLYQNLFEQSPWLTAAVFFGILLIGTACSLPITGVMVVAGGVVFGTLTGFVLSLLACTLGGTLSFFSSRFLFHDFIARRFSVQLEVINKGVDREGAFYLFGMRMIPLIPFWSLNLLVGLTAMRAPVFMLATLTGMVPVTLILANAGSQLGQIEHFSLHDLLSPGLILSLLLLASFPLLARLVVSLLRKKYNRAERDQGKVPE